MVRDVITPLIGFVGGQPDFSAIKIGPVALGNFLNAVIGFLIKAAVIYFLVVKPFSAFIHRWYPPPKPVDPPPSPEVTILCEIRDLLKHEQTGKMKPAQESVLGS
jgi:large conductance mechanosensitive channel